MEFTTQLAHHSQGVRLADTILILLGFVLYGTITLYGSPFQANSGTHPHRDSIDKLQFG